MVCYTNHALDQFIEDLLKIGIPRSDVVRLGGNASAEMEDLTLRKQPKVKRFTYMDHNFINLLRSLQTNASQSLRAIYGSYSTFYPYRHLEEIMDHIKDFHLEYFVAFTVPESDPEEIIVHKKGKALKKTYLLERWMSGHDTGIFKGSYRDPESAVIWSTDRATRQAILKSWIDEMIDDILESFHDEAKNYSDIHRQIEKKFSEGNVSVIKSKRVIACTTTGAAKYREDISAANPGVLVVEEAGEILESHILTALSSDMKQMILIGDHK